jgi:MFS family permease
MRTPTRTALTPLSAVLTFTILNTVGSAVVYSGVFALAERAYAFTTTQNFALGVVYGLAYIPGALAVGPLQRRLAQTLSPRAMLAVINVFLALLCYLPIFTTAILESSRDQSHARDQWPMWVMVAIYSFFSGMVWPLVESFLSGGRSGRDLRRATGQFNVAWSLPLVISMIAMGPLVKDHPLAILGGLGIIHILNILTLKWFTPSPGAHVHQEAHPVPPVYKELLAAFRFLLPAAFLVVAALSPYLPSAAEKLGLGVEWKTWLAAAWMAPRVAAFITLERWHGWHGRWSMPVVGGATLLVGFGLGVLSPPLLSGTPALIGTIAGLLVMGLGVGIIYTGALYYAMEAGAAEVDAGGTHEALIGIGYTAGPACGIALVGSGSGSSSEGSLSFEVLMLVFVALAALSLAAGAARKVVRSRHTRTSPESSSVPDNPPLPQPTQPPAP